MVSPTDVTASAAEAAAGASTDAGSIPSVSYDWKSHRKYVVFMIFIAYFLNSVDRNIISILQQPIKEEFGLLDWQLGLMTGFAFALFYNLVGLPTARFIDGGAIRTTILSAGIALWSFATAACGLAQNFWQLLLARAGVGVGEGTFGPCVVTLVSDYYGPAERARAIGTYLLGRPIAIVVGLGVGGFVAEEYGWRAALLLVGFPGLFIGLLLKLTVKEPPRGLADGKPTKVTAALPLMEVFRTVTKKKTVVFLLISAVFASFSTVGWMVWYPPFLQRAFGLNLGEVGWIWGLVAGVAGAVGAFGGGWLTDRLAARSKRYLMLFPAIAMLVSFPFFIAATLSTNIYACLAFLLIPATLNNSWIPAAMSSSQGLAPLAMRALLSMFVVVAANMIGHGISPPVIGILSDIYGSSIGDSAEGLRWALVTSGMFFPVAATFFWLASRNIEADFEK